MQDLNSDVKSLIIVFLNYCFPLLNSVNVNCELIKCLILLLVYNNNNNNKVNVHEGHLKTTKK